MHPNKPLRIVAIILAVVAAVSVLGTAAVFITARINNGKDAPATPMDAVPAAASDTVPGATEPTASVVATEPAASAEPAATEAEAPAKAAVSAEAIVAIFMAHKDVWMPDLSEYSLNGVEYGFLDLDFDGIPELIVDNYAGSGRYSYNTYFKADPDSGTVKEISCSADYQEMGYDLFFLSEENAPRLLRNKETGALCYYCVDLLRISTGDYALYYGTMKYTGEKIVCNVLFMHHWEEAGRYDNPEEVNEYAIFHSGQETTADEETYTREQDAFFSQYEDMGLQFGTVSMHDFNDADSDAQTAMLLDACRAFRYDGFSIQ